VSCGTLLRFDFRRRLILGLFVGVFFALMMGVAVLCLMFRISPWIWAFPLVVIDIVGTIFIIARGDRIIVAEQRKDDSHALPNDA
jgi:ABC-type bacteriocin/lantibiotic exporter with double-glycine peptidase domain